MDKKSVLFFLMHCLFAGMLGILLVAAYAGMAYLRDPLHLFQTPKGETVYLDRHLRQQAAGLIRHYEFDSIILGSSILQNSSAKGMGQELGGTFMNLSMAASRFWERSIILNYALKHKEIKQVVYSLDHNWLEEPGTANYAPRMWTFLYNDSKLDDLKVYLTSTYFKNIMLGIPSGRKDRLDAPGEWMSDLPKHMRNFGGMHEWVAKLATSKGMRDFLLKDLQTNAANADPSAPLVRDSKNEAHMKEVLERELFSFAKAHPDIQFFLVLPPSWRYVYAKWRQVEPAFFSLHYEAIRYVVHRAEQLGNVKVFGFDDCSFVDDVANYKDTVHYLVWISDYIAESMGVGRHRLTPDNVEAYLARCEELARNFDIKALNEEVQKLLAEKK